jgi:dTDP-4-amino-4,6-dideoxygalactose transaminase
MEDTMAAAVAWNARPFLHGTEAAEMLSALHSLNWGNSSLVADFEQGLAAFLGVPDVVTVSSGTIALHIGLLAAGVGAGDEVVVPSMTFCASVQAILASGARPRFVEVDPESLCVTAADLLDAVTPATRAVMPVLYGGRAVDMSGVRDALRVRGIVIIEDAAHAFGSWCGPVRVGATGNLTAFSFDPIKNLTSGEGGALVPVDADQARVIRAMRGLGAVGSTAPDALESVTSVEYPGVRARLSAMHAAVGVVQLRHFGVVEAKRRSLWRAYAAELQDVEGLTLVDVDIDRSVPFHLVVRVMSGRDQLFRLMRGKSVGVGIPYPPNHLEPAFAAWHRPLPVTEVLGQQIMSLPFHPAMAEDDVRLVVSMLREAMHEAGG